MAASTTPMKQRRRPLTGWLQAVILLQMLLHFMAAALHLGLRLTLGPWVLAVPDVIVPAAIAETLLGLVVAASLAALILGTPRQWALTLAAHVFALLGVVFGMVALYFRVGPPPSAHWTLHY